MSFRKSLIIVAVGSFPILTVRNAGASVLLAHIQQTLSAGSSAFPNPPAGTVPGVYLAYLGTSSERFGLFPVTNGSIDEILHRSDDPAGWDSMIAQLTDGQDEYLFVGFQSGAAILQIYNNIGLFEGPNPAAQSDWGIGNPDLVGSTVDYVRLVATSLDPFDVNQRWEFYGTPAPEPSSLAFLGAGIGMFIWRRSHCRPS